jgi:hypothetical protein
MRTRRPDRERRIKLEAAARLVTCDEEVAVTFKDVSRRGFKLHHSNADLIAGEVVTIATRRSTARAQLHWVTATEAGGTFLEDVDVAI